MRLQIRGGRLCNYRSSWTVVSLCLKRRRRLHLEQSLCALDPQLDSHPTQRRGQSHGVLARQQFLSQPPTPTQPFRRRDCAHNSPAPTSARVTLPVQGERLASIDPGTSPATDMAHLNFGGTDEENKELKELHAEVVSPRARRLALDALTTAQLENPDDFEAWEKLVRAAESLEGGLNRNSSPQAIAAARDTYDRFLAKFPLFFGYWKKYADLEFSIAGTEAADMVGVPAHDSRHPGLTPGAGVRAGRCKHHEFRRSVDQLLRLQGRDQPRLGRDSRVSILQRPFLPFNHQARRRHQRRK